MRFHSAIWTAAAVSIALVGNAPFALTQSTPQAPIPHPALVLRWAELTALLLEEFDADQREVGTNLEADFSTRQFRIRKDVGGGEAWADRTLTEEELRAGDLHELARELYAFSQPVKRWSQLFAFVLREFQAAGRDPTANIEADFSERMITLRAAEGSAWRTRILTERELAIADLRELARVLYSGAIASPGPAER